MSKFVNNSAMAAAVLACAVGARAQVVMDMVTIRNPGNLGETSGENVNLYGNAYGFGETRVCGAVDYVYEIGKFEVTAAQYVEFLNAVAGDDTYGLYNTFAMPQGEPNTINIERFGAPGSYWYTVPADWANRPVGGTSWADALRFCNWMHNGQPAGAQGPATTEDGSYTLNGATTNPELQQIVRNPGATWVLPSEDEWYKAAYHKNNGPSGSYWDFACRSDYNGWAIGGPNNNVINPDPGNSACFWIGPNDQCIGPPYFRTPVGEFENSGSNYGTFDQSGNVWEWTDSRPSVSGAITSKRVMRGGSFYNTQGADFMHASWRNSEFTAAQLSRYGFRLARPLPDQNHNGIADRDEILSGAATDYNFNGVPDDADIANGTSPDCNSNGIPDEAEVGAVTPTPYRWDDGLRDEQLGVGPLLLNLPDGSMAWLNQHTVEGGRETITGIAISFGYVDNGTDLAVYLWSDPNGDGTPDDAVVIASAATTVSNSNSDVMKIIDLPDTYVGPAGTSFFVGAVMMVTADTLPANMDYSGHLSASVDRSWLYYSFDTENPLDPNSLGSLSMAGTAADYGFPGNWCVWGLPASTVFQQDVDQSGVPDDCEYCPSDFNRDGFIDPLDYNGFINAFEGGDMSADFNHDGFLDPLDYNGYINAFESGC